MYRRSQEKLCAAENVAQSQSGIDRWREGAFLSNEVSWNFDADKQQRFEPCQQLSVLYGISLLLHNCEDRFHIQVFIRSSNIWLSYIPSHLFTTSRVYLEPTQWPAPNWLVSSLGRALHRYRRGHGFKSRTGLNFFRAFFSLLLKIAFISTS